MAPGEGPPRGQEGEDPPKLRLVSGEVEGSKGDVEDAALQEASGALSRAVEDRRWVGGKRGLEGCKVSLEWEEVVSNGRHDFLGYSTL